MQVVVESDKVVLGKRAAESGAREIQAALARDSHVRIILATGASQFEMLLHLVRQPIDWPRVTCFHLDEYVGMEKDHPASFRRYLKERFLDRLPSPPAAFHMIDGTGDPQMECLRLGRLLARDSIEVAFIGIGENGHLAFNDPPADFETQVPYLVVQLDEACRQQQYGEGWFPTFNDVPREAISMSISQIMKTRKIICTVPDSRKAIAVRNALEGQVSPDCPASILQRHPDVELYLDRESSALLNSTN